MIEAGIDKSKGPFATFIVQNGSLKRGDIVVCGEAFGKVGRHVNLNFISNKNDLNIWFLSSGQCALPFLRIDKHILLLLSGEGFIR